MYTDQFLNRFILPADLGAALRANRALCFPETLDELTELCYGPAHADSFDVSYDIEGMGRVKEAEVHRCKNGVAVNFTEDYMRRRDGGCMRIGDDLPSDKPSGLKEAMRVLDGVEGVGICRLTQNDVVRHIMVQRIIEAYAKFEEKKKK
mgnify:FL=1